jgi:hypothetical protein
VQHPSQWRNVSSLFSQAYLILLGFLGLFLSGDRTAAVA